MKQVDEYIVDRVIEAANKENKEETEQEFMDRIMAEVEREAAQYMVCPGDVVHLGREGTFLVTNIILGKELEQTFQSPKIWKLFTMVGMRCGVNWSHPIPVMSEGRVDIRQLVGTHVGSHMITSIKYKKGAGTSKRTYKITEDDGRWYAMVVKNRGTV